jgi:GDP-L-fucose synthase
VDLMTDGDADLYEGQEIVFWGAAKVGGAKAIKEDPMGLVQYNLELASKNIHAAVKAKVERFCYLSSSYVYPTSALPSGERDIYLNDVPIEHYGLGHIKRFMENLCRAHLLTSETRFSLVRPTAIYGPHDNFDLESCHVIPALIRKVAEEQNPLEVWGDGSEQRQFTYVDDLAEGMMRATAVYATAEPINIATPQVSTVLDVVRELLNIVGRPWFKDITPEQRLIDRGPPQLVNFIGDKPTTISKRLVDVGKCKRMLGYECKTTLRDGLEKTYGWYGGIV